MKAPHKSILKRRRLLASSAAWLTESISYSRLNSFCAATSKSFDWHCFGGLCGDFAQRRRQKFRSTRRKLRRAHRLYSRRKRAFSSALEHYSQGGTLVSGSRYALEIYNLIKRPGKGAGTFLLKPCVMLSSIASWRVGVQRMAIQEIIYHQAVKMLCS